MNTDKQSNKNSCFNPILKNLVSENNDKISAIVKKDLAIVNDLDEQILRLIRERNYILYGLNCKCLKYRKTTFILSADHLLKVWKEYNKNGFKSKLVKDAIASLRDIFFDDEQEKYHKLACSHIVHDEYGYGSNVIDFIFEDDNKHSMRLTFDIKAYENDCLYKNKLLNSYMYFSTKTGRDYCTVEMSIDIKEIRAAIEKWIDNGFTAEKYKFIHMTLLNNATEIFTEFENMRISDAV